MKHRWLFLIYILISLGLIFYSYTQVDLNLTLSGNLIYQSVQAFLTQIGYFNRPLSSSVYLILVGLLFCVYIYCLGQLIKGKLEKKTIKWLIGISLILVFAYPAFSYDLFNYMFDARIVTRYGLDPHFFKALDFPLDPWVRFMRWTHRYYPYGPGWLLLTLVPSYLGFGKFVLTLFLFKVMFLFFHLGTSIMIWRIAERWGMDRQNLALVFYALNPLVLIESLVSPHNEVMMIAFALMAIFFLIKRRTIISIIFLTISISFKFLSVVLFPLFWWVKPTTTRFYSWAFWVWIVALIPVILSREPYSWYAIPLVALAALCGQRKLHIAVVGVTFGLMLRYMPYLLRGEYGVVTGNYQNWIFISGTLITAFALFIIWQKNPPSASS
ncbi:MAG: hypothetical protein AAB874_01160 [Patescibacteria group bacterium]